MSNQKTVLVTGGAGFIGSHLSEKLVAKGDKVFVLDDLSTGSLNNIKHLLSNKDFSFKKGSVLNGSLVKKMIANVDEVYHLAAAVGVQTIMDKPLDSLLTNIKGTEVVLGAAESKKTPVFVASSSEIYGKNTRTPFNEDDDRIYGSVQHYRWGYAFSKGVDEFLALAYFRERGLPVRIARFFNTVGPRQTGSYGMVIPRFVKSALAGEDIVVYGSGHQTRSFGYVGDVVDAVIKIMAHPKSSGQIYNLGSNIEISINELAKKIIALTESKSKIVRIPYEKAYGEGYEDMMRRSPDISRAKKLIGYNPKSTLDDVIRKIIEYQKNVL